MAKRIDIRQFQAQLAQALLDAQRGQGEEAARWLAVRAGSHGVLLSVSETAGVIHEWTLYSVPFAPALYCGLTNVRGELYDVIDLATAMGQTAAASPNTARLVLVAPQVAPRLALLVTQVVGLRRATALQPLSATLGTPTWRDEAGKVWEEVALRSLIAQIARNFLPASRLSGVAP